MPLSKTVESPFGAALAPYACQPSASRGRLHPEPESRERTPHQRDRDRILHSGAFRKLEYKTQVFIYHEGDYYRTRLTHSLEVAQIARSVARSLHLNEDLAEALALAHDLGHTPFGHAGEDALDACMKPYGGFDHNDQALRVLVQLEQRYADFDGLLDALSPRKRKTIRKERREAAGHGVDIRMLTGDAIEPRHWDAFHRFYIDTSSRKWGSAYLNRAFFHLLGERMADRVLLVMAEHDGVLVGGALNLIGDDTLYGRNWGCVADYRFLHFECCYYRAIDFAIERGLKRVEAGAQGPHKIQRGYRPTYTRSCHWIPDPGFRRAVSDFLDRERRHMELEKQHLEEATPFRKEG